VSREPRNEAEAAGAVGQGADAWLNTQATVHEWAACQSGPCRQGSKICPTPQACRLVEGGARADANPRALFWLGLAAALVAALACLVVFGGKP